MRVAVTGSHGLIGTALVDALRERGDDVVRLVRGTPSGPGEVQWDPAAGSVDLPGLAGVEAAVHLAGAGVGDHRWTAEYKRVIRDSRVLGTRTLVRALTALDPLPKVLVSGSAVGFYGDRGDEVLTEASSTGDNFLAGVVRDWEAETGPAQAAGIRVGHARTGLVMARSGGAFAPLLLLAKLGLAGPLGNGRQWWPWITLPDQVGALLHVLDSEVTGPVNLSAPGSARNIDVMRAIARALHRPALVPAPAFALRLIVGEFAGDIVASQRMVPERLVADGFTFTHPDLASAANWLAGN